MKPNSNKPGTTPLQQVAALPLRQQGERLEVCLITTRTTPRWTIPKGWPMKGRKDCVAAQIEAEQEAGLIGKASKAPIGTYSYWKRLDDHFEFVEVTVFALQVSKCLSTWREKAERQLQWVALDEASTIVVEPGLAALMLKLDADAGRGGAS